MCILYMHVFVCICVTTYLLWGPCKAWTSFQAFFVLFLIASLYFFHFFRARRQLALTSSKIHYSRWDSGQGKTFPPRRSQVRKRSDGGRDFFFFLKYAVPFSSEIVSFLLIQGSDSILRWENLSFFTQSYGQWEFRNRIAKFTKLASKLPESSKTYLSALPRPFPTAMLGGRMAEKNEAGCQRTQKNEEWEQLSFDWDIRSQQVI